MLQMRNKLLYKFKVLQVLKVVFLTGNFHGNGTYTQQLSFDLFLFIRVDGFGKNRPPSPPNIEHGRRERGHIITDEYLDCLQIYPMDLEFFLY